MSVRKDKLLPNKILHQYCTQIQVSFPNLTRILMQGLQMPTGTGHCPTLHVSTEAEPILASE